MQTKAQKTISTLQRKAKRTQKQTWADVEKLSEMFAKVTTDFQKTDFYRQGLEPTNFYRQGMDAII